MKRRDLYILGIALVSSSAFEIISAIRHTQLNAAAGVTGLILGVSLMVIGRRRS